MEKLPQHILFVLFSYLPKVTDGTYNLIKYPETFILEIESLIPVVRV